MNTSSVSTDVHRETERVYVMDRMCPCVGAYDHGVYTAERARRPCPAEHRWERRQRPAFLDNSKCSCSDLTVDVSIDTHIHVYIDTQMYIYGRLRTRTYGRSVRVGIGRPVNTRAGLLGVPGTRLWSLSGNVAETFADTRPGLSFRFLLFARLSERREGSGFGAFQHAKRNARRFFR